MKVLESLAPVNADEDASLAPSSDNFERFRRQVPGGAAVSSNTEVNANKTERADIAQSKQADGPELSSVKGANEPKDVPHPLTPPYYAQPPPAPPVPPPAPPPAPPVVVTTKITPLPAMINGYNNKTSLDSPLSKTPTDSHQKLAQDSTGPGEGSAQTNGLSTEEAAFISSLRNSADETPATTVLPGSVGAIADTNLEASGSGAGEHVASDASSGEVASGSEVVSEHKDAALSSDKHNEIEVETTSGTNFLSGDNDKDSSGESDNDEALPGSLGAFKGIEKIEKKAEESKKMKATKTVPANEAINPAETVQPASVSDEEKPAAQITTIQEKPAATQETVSEVPATKTAKEFTQAVTTAEAPSNVQTPTTTVQDVVQTPVTPVQTPVTVKQDKPAADDQQASTVQEAAPVKPAPVQVLQSETPKIETAPVQPQKAEITTQTPQKSAALDEEEDLMSSGSGMPSAQRVTYESFPEIQTETVHVGSGATESSGLGQHALPYKDPNYIKEEQPEPRHPTVSVIKPVQATKETASDVASGSGSGLDATLVADSDEQLPGSVGAMGPNLMTMNNLAGSGGSASDSSASGSGAPEHKIKTQKKDEIEESPEMDSSIESDTFDRGSGDTIEDDIQTSESSSHRENNSKASDKAPKMIEADSYEGPPITSSKDTELDDTTGSKSVESITEPYNGTTDGTVDAIAKDTVTALPKQEDSTAQTKPLPESLGVEESISFSGSGASQSSGDSSDVPEETSGEGSAQGSDQLQQFKKTLQAEEAVEPALAQPQNDAQPEVSLKLPPFDLSKDSSLKAALGQAVLNNAPLTIGPGTGSNTEQEEGSSALEGSGLTGTLELTPVNSEEVLEKQSGDASASADVSTSGISDIEEEQPDVEVEKEDEEVSALQMILLWSSLCNNFFIFCRASMKDGQNLVIL